MFVFCPNYTRSSSLAPKYITTLNEICQRDYGKAFFADTIICLDLDAYESACSGNNDATMDGAVGMADWNNRPSGERHLLVELRFDYQSARNFDIGNMKRKVTHSKDILKTERVNDNVVFIYDSNVVPQAINRFSRLAAQDKEIRKWLPMDPVDFKDFIFDSSTLPYVPENNLNAIRNDLNNKYKKEGLDGLDSLVQYWINQMMIYGLRYKHAESNAIAEVIFDFLQSLSPCPGSIEEDYIALLKEEVGSFLLTKDLSA